MTYTTYITTDGSTPSLVSLSTSQSIIYYPTYLTYPTYTSKEENLFKNKIQKKRPKDFIEEKLCELD